MGWRTKAGETFARFNCWCSAGGVGNLRSSQDILRASLANVISALASERTMMKLSMPGDAYSGRGAMIRLLVFELDLVDEFVRSRNREVRENKTDIKAGLNVIQ